MSRPIVSVPSPLGALVISLDFELHWGVRDTVSSNSPYHANLLGARDAVIRMLELFTEYEVAATWATVGFLFATDAAELQRFSPHCRPVYRDTNLDPYAEPIGENESTDPLHFAPSLISRIMTTPRQEIGSHTFSHYYCFEPGQTEEAFRADLGAAVEIARARGVHLSSIVFPRNQHRRTYDDALRLHNLSTYRGCQRGWMYRATSGANNSRVMRMARFVDSYVPISGKQTTDWNEIPQRNGLQDVRASMFLRPVSSRLRWLEPLRRRRVMQSIEHAARAGRVMHMWWHPHNFGASVDESISSLRTLLDAFRRCRDRYGMRSMTMSEAGRAAASGEMVPS